VPRLTMAQEADRGMVRHPFGEPAFIFLQHDRLASGIPATLEAEMACQPPCQGAPQRGACNAPAQAVAPDPSAQRALALRTSRARCSWRDADIKQSVAAMGQRAVERHRWDFLVEPPRIDAGIIRNQRAIREDLA